MISGRLKGMVIRHEGIKLKPYRDTVGKLTIAVGRNLDDRGISVGESSIMLENDLAQWEQELTDLFFWFKDLDEVRHDVLIDMCHNLGSQGVFNFRKMCAALSRKDYQQAAVEMLDSQWATQVGQRAQELATMMRSGSY